MAQKMYILGKSTLTVSMHCTVSLQLQLVDCHFEEGTENDISIIMDTFRLKDVFISNTSQFKGKLGHMAAILTLHCAT